MSDNCSTNDFVKSFATFWFIKSNLPYIVFFIAAVCIIFGIYRCNIERNDKNAYKATEKYVLSKLDLPFSAENTFKYSETIYNEDDLEYSIKGCIETTYANKKTEIKHFKCVVKAYGNDPDRFQVMNLEFIEEDIE